MPSGTSAGLIFLSCAMAVVLSNAQYCPRPIITSGLLFLILLCIGLSVYLFLFSVTFPTILISIFSSRPYFPAPVTTVEDEPIPGYFDSWWRSTYASKILQKLVIFFLRRWSFRRRSGRKPLVFRLILFLLYWHLLFKCGDVELNPGPQEADVLLQNGCKYSLGIFSANVNGLRTRVGDLTDLVETYSPGIVCLQETRLTGPRGGVIDPAPVLSDITSMGYSYAGFNRKNRGGGGVGMLIQTGLKPRPIRGLYKHPDFEVVARQVTCWRREFTVVSLYNNKSENLREFLDHLNNFVATLPNPNQTLLLGDLNCCALLPEFGPLSTFCLNYGFEQLIQENTHKNRAIDHVYLGSGLKSLGFGLLSPLEKHHAVPWVFVDAGKPSSRPVPESAMVYNFKQANWALLADLLLSANLPKVVSTATNVDEAWNSWCLSVFQALPG